MHWFQQFLILTKSHSSGHRAVQWVLFQAVDNRKSIPDGMHSCVQGIGRSILYRDQACLLVCQKQLREQLQDQNSPDLFFSVVQGKVPWFHVFRKLNHQMI